MEIPGFFLRLNQINIEIIYFSVMIAYTKRRCKSTVQKTIQTAVTHYLLRMRLQNMREIFNNDENMSSAQIAMRSCVNTKYPDSCSRTIDANTLCYSIVLRAVRYKQLPQHQS